jgi:hypothetical protein
MCVFLYYFRLYYFMCTVIAQNSKQQQCVRSTCSSMSFASSNDNGQNIHQDKRNGRCRPSVGKGEGACVSDDFRVTGIMMFSSRDPMHAGVVE